MMMENIKIKHTRRNYWQVVADTERFGEQEILFEGIKFEECINFIEENQGNSPYTAEIQDAWNNRKIWLVKYTKCRHYSINQMLAGKKINKGYTRTSKAHVMEIIAAIQEEEKPIALWENYPDVVNGGEADREYKLALITENFVYYVDMEESDENGCTVMHRTGNFEMISNNIFATNSLMEELQKIHDGELEPEYISPELEEEIRLKAESGWFDE